MRRTANPEVSFRECRSSSLASNLLPVEFQCAPREHRSSGDCRGDELMWMLLVSNAATLGALLVTGRLQPLQCFVMSFVCVKTIHDGHEWISFEQYLIRRFNIQLSQALSPKKSTRLRDRRALVSVEETATAHSRVRYWPGQVEPHDRARVSPRSALEEFPEESSLRGDANRRVPADPTTSLGAAWAGLSCSR